MDCHHLGVHGEGSVGVITAASTDFLESSKLSRRLWRRLLLVLRIRLLLLAFLQLCLQLGEGSAAEGTACDTAMLESAAIESRTVVVVALADDLAAAHNDAAVAVVQRGLSSLLEAEREVVVRLQFAVSFGLFVGSVGEGDLGVRYRVIDRCWEEVCCGW